MKFSNKKSTIFRHINTPTLRSRTHLHISKGTVYVIGITGDSQQLISSIAFVQLDLSLCRFQHQDYIVHS